MFKSNQQRAAFFENMKKKGTLNNPAANSSPKIGSPIASPLPMNPAQNALNGVTGQMPKFNNIKKLMKPKI